MINKFNYPFIHYFLYIINHLFTELITLLSRTWRPRQKVCVWLTPESFQCRNNNLTIYSEQNGSRWPPVYIQYRLWQASSYTQVYQLTGTVAQINIRIYLLSTLGSLEATLQIKCQFRRTPFEYLTQCSPVDAQPWRRWSDEPKATRRSPNYTLVQLLFYMG